MAERFPEFEIQESQELKEIQKTIMLRNVHRPGSMSGPPGSKTRTLKPICSPTKRNNSTKSCKSSSRYMNFSGCSINK